MQHALATTKKNVNSRAIDIVNQHINAFLNNDADAVIADYADDAILVTPDASYHGPMAIKEFFKGLIPHFPKGYSSFILDKMEDKGDLVYILWHGRSSSVDVPFATDTFMVRGGKIQQQTFAGLIQFVP